MRDDRVYDLPLYLVELGRGEQYLAATAGVPGHLWQLAGRAAAAGELGAAAATYGRIGARFCEAWAALLAAERGEPVPPRRRARVLRRAAGDPVHDPLPRADAGVRVTADRAPGDWRRRAFGSG